MGSSRLPGKVLLRMQGKTILERCVERLRAAETIDRVVVLTTTLPDDDAIQKEAHRLGVWTYRGPELDVLERYLEAARCYKPEIVVRATADNPLIDIGSVDRIVRAVRSSRLDYCMEHGLPYGAASEAITWQALERVGVLAVDCRYREHVTLYVKEHPEAFRMALLAPPDSLRHPEIRITVDTPQDFFFVESLIDQYAESERPVPLVRYLQSLTSLYRAKV
jgi:spore coat polysaccharide biosynthesis protein SpsF